MFRIALTMTVALVVSACGSGSSDLAVTPAPTPAPPPPSSSVTFSNFVKDEITNTSDKREPVAINGLEFEFAENPNAFDSLFSTSN